jgi:hypothetical protein
LSTRAAPRVAAVSYRAPALKDEEDGEGKKKKKDGKMVVNGWKG